MCCMYVSISLSLSLYTYIYIYIYICCCLTSAMSSRQHDQCAPTQQSGVRK